MTPLPVSVLLGRVVGLNPTSTFIGALREDNSVLPLKPGFYAAWLVLTTHTLMVVSRTDAVSGGDLFLLFLGNAIARRRAGDVNFVKSVPHNCC